MCEYIYGTVHDCFEYPDDQTAAEGENWCRTNKGAYHKATSCPAVGRTGACRLRGGEARYTYDATPATLKGRCGAERGKFAEGAAAPADDPVTTFVCAAPDGSRCAIDKVHVNA